jgi:hypothetical protein
MGLANSVFGINHLNHLILAQIMAQVVAHLVHLVVKATNIRSILTLRGDPRVIEYPSRAGWQLDQGVLYRGYHPSVKNRLLKAQWRPNSWQLVKLQGKLPG